MIDLDPPANRDLARELAERAIVLVRNDGTLPLAGEAPSVIAVIGPNADDRTRCSAATPSRRTS